MQTTAPGRGEARDRLVGRRLEGRYRLLNHLADGGMSRVYAALDERLDRLVAVKIMSAALSADPAFSDRFAREARAAARLTHLNVVSVYDQGADAETDGRHVFLVMELVEGRTLRDLLRERGRLGPAEAVSLMEPVLSALSAAHRAGLVHRDVKPENILLSDDGIVKVADFGLAHAVEADPHTTRTGPMMGTVAYCAPEQLSDARADPRSDVYSAGVVLFELLTGAPPFRGDTAMAVAYQHVHSRVPAPSSRLEARIPTELDELVVAATDRDPDGRPTDAGDFLAQLADLRADLALPVVPVPPRPRTPGQHTPRRGLGGPGQRATGGVAGPDHTTALVDGSGGRHDTTVVDDRRPPAPQDPPRGDEPPPPPVVIPPGKPRRRRRALIALLIVVVLGGVAAWIGVWASHHFLRHVPQVGGESVSAATAELRDAGYDMQIAPGRLYSDTVPAGAVISSAPRSGTRLTEGGVVTVTLSLGQRHVTVPDVHGRDIGAARDLLAQRGLTNVDRTPVKVASTSVPANQIIRSRPAAGASVTLRTPIVLTVSTGPPVVDVPAIAAGTSVDDATDTLQDAHFKVDTAQRQYDDTVADGAIISCNPTGMAFEGTTVTCVVSRGPEFVTLPDIGLGTALDDARGRLEDLGLKVRVTHLDPRKNPVVASMSPGGGTSVRVGSTVRLTVV